MDALEMAHKLLQKVIDAYDAAGRASTNDTLVMAQAYAAIATAEAAQRQAAALEKISRLMEAYADIYLDGAVTSIANGTLGKDIHDAGK
jgi:hypothetical protein